MMKKVRLLLVLLLYATIIHAQQASVLANAFYDNTNQRVVIRLAIRNNTNSAATCQIAAMRIGYQFNETVLNYAGFKSWFYNGSNQATGLNDATVYFNSNGDFDTELNTPVDDGTRTANITAGGTKLLRKNYFNRSTSNCADLWTVPANTYRLAFDIYFTFKAGYTPVQYNLNTPGYGFGTTNFIAQFITSINQDITDAKKEIAVLIQNSGSSPYQPWDQSGSTCGSNVNPIPINDNNVNFLDPLNGILAANAELPALADRKDHVLVQWEAANNELADYYEIERGDGEGVFKTAGIIMGDGNAATTTYSFKDKVTVRDLQLHYRIRTVNTDGTFHYSSTATIKLSSVQKQIVNVFPNPAAENIRIELPVQTGNYVCRIYNSSGSMIMTVNISKGNPFIVISKLSTGAYFMELYQPQSGIRYYAQFSKQ